MIDVKLCYQSSKMVKVTEKLINIEDTKLQYLDQRFLSLWVAYQLKWVVDFMPFNTEPLFTK